MLLIARFWAWAPPIQNTKEKDWSIQCMQVQENMCDPITAWPRWWASYTRGKTYSSKERINKPYVDLKNINQTTFTGLHAMHDLAKWINISSRNTVWENWRWSLTWEKTYSTVLNCNKCCSLGSFPAMNSSHWFKLALVVFRVVISSKAMIPRWVNLEMVASICSKCNGNLNIWE